MPPEQLTNVDRRIFIAMTKKVDDMEKRIKTLETDKSLRDAQPMKSPMDARMVLGGDWIELKFDPNANIDRTLVPENRSVTASTLFSAIKDLCRRVGVKEISLDIKNI